MGGFSKLGYKSISVDLASMRELSKRLRSDGEKLRSLMEKMTDDICQLGYKWEDDNYARFVLYYLDREGPVRYYRDFAQNQADWLDRAIPVYESLPGDIVARIDSILEDALL